MIIKNKKWFNTIKRATFLIYFLTGYVLVSQIAGPLLNESLSIIELIAFILYNSFVASLITMILVLTTTSFENIKRDKTRTIFADDCVSLSEENGYLIISEALNPKKLLIDNQTYGDTPRDKIKGVPVDILKENRTINKVTLNYYSKKHKCLWFTHIESDVCGMNCDVDYNLTPKLLNALDANVQVECFLKQLMTYPT